MLYYHYFNIPWNSKNPYSSTFFDFLLLLYPAATTSQLEDHFNFSTFAGSSQSSFLFTRNQLPKDQREKSQETRTIHQNRFPNANEINLSDHALPSSCLETLVYILPYPPAICGAEKFIHPLPLFPELISVFVGSSREYINTIEPVVLTGARKTMVRRCCFTARDLAYCESNSYEFFLFSCVCVFFLNNIFLGFRRWNNA